MTTLPLAILRRDDVNDIRTPGRSLIDGYRVIEDLVGSMADAAERGDWARFQRVHRDVESTIATLPPVDPDDDISLGPAERRARFALLSRILAHDARIRDAIEPCSPALDGGLGRRPFGALGRGSG
jgi:hypothetical protein